MSRETKNLKLFKYDPTQDGECTFNIDDALNKNWDKIDEEVNKIDEEVNKINTEIKKVNDKANKREIIIKDIVISKDSWLTFTTGTYICSISNNDIKKEDSVDINFSYNDIFSNRTEGILSATESDDSGFCRIYSTKKPTTDLNATLVIHKRVI